MGRRSTATARVSAGARPRCAQQRPADRHRTQLPAALQEQATHATDLRLAQPLPPGQYYWRVASRDGEGRQGRYGQALPLQLSNEPVDPALQPPEAAHGELTLRWQAGSDGQRYRVQVDRRGDFRHRWSTKPWTSRR